MRVLILTCMFPLPLNNGVRMRIWSLMRALAAEGHDLRLLCLAPPDEPGGDDTPLREICSRIDVVPLAFSSSFNTANYADRLRKLFTPLPFGVARFECAEMQSRIAAYASDTDVIWAETCYPPVNVPKRVSVPVIIDNHNVEHMLVRRYVAQEKNPIKLGYAWTEFLKLRHWEQACWSSSAGVLACSEADQAIIRDVASSTPAVVVPNTIDVDTYLPTPGEPATIVYSGTMDWFPNRDAVEYFALQMLPEIRRRVPSVRFIVAGRTAPEDFRMRFADMPDIHFTGTVPDMRVEIGRAAVCVVPLRIGSGTRLKILEAAAMGKAIVSTSVGAEGLDFENGREIILADSPEEFAGAVARLLEDPLARERLGTAARNKVVDAYSFASMRRALRAALEHVSKHNDALVGSVRADK